MAYIKNAPFRADVVGSFLRPDVLKQARADFAAGVIDEAALRAVEDEAIRDLVAKQKAAGLHVITDGEFRRSYWHLDFMWGLQGIERRTSRSGYQSSTTRRPPPTLPWSRARSLARTTRLWSTSSS